jgi:hypothetical protein
MYNAFLSVFWSLIPYAKAAKLWPWLNFLSSSIPLALPAAKMRYLLSLLFLESCWTIFQVSSDFLNVGFMAFWLLAPRK